MVKHLVKRPESCRVLLLIPGGGDDSGSVPPEAAAAMAAGQGLRIYTVGIGSDMTDTLNFTLIGRSGGPALDEESLKKIAQMTGGRYFRARSTEDLKEISDTLDHLEPVDQAPVITSQVFPLDAWPLGASLLLTLAFMAGSLPARLFSRRSA